MYNENNAENQLSDAKFGPQLGFFAVLCRWAIHHVRFLSVYALAREMTDSGFPAGKTGCAARHFRHQGPVAWQLHTEILADWPNSFHAGTMTVPTKEDVCGR